MLSGAAGAASSALAREPLARARAGADPRVEWIAATATAALMPLGAAAHLIPGDATSETRDDVLRAIVATLQREADDRDLWLGVDDAPPPRRRLGGAGAAAATNRTTSVSSPSAAVNQRPTRSARCGRTTGSRCWWSRRCPGVRSTTSSPRCCPVRSMESLRQLLGPQQRERPVPPGGRPPRSGVARCASRTACGAGPIRSHRVTGSPTWSRCAWERCLPRARRPRGGGGRRTSASAGARNLAPTDVVGSLERRGAIASSNDAVGRGAPGPSPLRGGRARSDARHARP